MSPVGWLVTQMECMICGRKWVHRHPPAADTVSCPDCGHPCRIDCGLTERQVECDRCHVVRALHEYYRLADGRLDRVTVCRQCRRKERRPPTPPPEITRGD